MDDQVSKQKQQWDDAQAKILIAAAFDRVLAAGELKISSTDYAEILKKLIANAEYIYGPNKNNTLPSTGYLDFVSKLQNLANEFTADCLTLQQYLAAALKQPSLFHQSSANVSANILDLVHKFDTNGLTVSQYLAAALRQPSLFAYSPITIADNINGLAKEFIVDGLTVPQYLAAALKQPSLFYRTPATITANIKNLVQEFAADGLTVPQYLAAALKKPPLFCQIPATITANIKGLVQEFADDDLTVTKYLAAALKQPSLFCQAPATIAGNIRGLVQEFAQDGLTVTQYLVVALKQPSLFCRTPTSIAANIKGLVQEFIADDLTVPQYLAAALKQPQLFYLSPDTITEHLKIIRSIHWQLDKVTDWQKILCVPSTLSLSSANLKARNLIKRQTGKSASSLLKISKTNLSNQLVQTYDLHKLLAKLSDENFKLTDYASAPLQSRTEAQQNKLQAAVALCLLYDAFNKTKQIDQPAKRLNALLNTL